MGQHECAERRIPSGSNLHDWVERRGYRQTSGADPYRWLRQQLVISDAELNREQFGLACWRSQDGATRLGQSLNAVMCVESAINRRQMDLYRPDRQPEAACDRLGGTAFC
jgi:hypothetical protein